MIALRNATLYTVTAGIFDNGTILIEDGKIKGIGSDIKIPEGSKIYDLKGKSITPGFIDAHCHVGVFNEGIGDMGFDGNDATSPVTPEIRAIDGIYGEDEAFDDARKAGITTLCVGPGSANVIGGQMCVVKPRSKIVEQMLVEDYNGLKSAFGENPKRVYGSQNKMPQTRMGVAAVMRKAFMDVQKYAAKKIHHENTPAEKDKPKAPFETDYNKEIILQVLNRNKSLRAHAHRTDDIQSAIRIAEEFGIELVIEHCTEGWRIADYLADKGVGVILGPLESTKPKSELRYLTMEAARILEEAGIPFAMMTDAPVIKIASLWDVVRSAMREGLSKKAAMECVTINPAKILRMDNRIGSLEHGKDADIVVWDGDPYDFNTPIVATFIDGKLLEGEL